MLQGWITLRYSDHIGIDPKTLVVTGSQFTGLLARSETSDRDSWWSTHAATSATPLGCPPSGLSHAISCFSNAATCCRAASSSLTSCAEDGDALENFISCMLKSGEATLPQQCFTNFWAPHSRRAFMARGRRWLSRGSA